MIQNTQFGKSAGKSLACLGGLLAIFSFLVLPWISLGFFGSYSAMQILLSFNQEFQNFQASSFLWFELVSVGGITALSFIAFIKKEIEQAISFTVILLGTSALFGMMGMYIVLNQYHFFMVSFTTFLGAGWWWYVFGIALALVGGIIQQVIVRTHTR